MKTRVAEINGEAILVFRAENDDASQRIIRDEDSSFQPVVRGCSGLLRADGRPLWDVTSMRGDGLQPALRMYITPFITARVSPPLAAATSGRRNRRLDIGPFVIGQVAREPRQGTRALSGR
jgi:hypothetical protein